MSSGLSHSQSWASRGPLSNGERVVPRPSVTTVGRVLVGAKAHIRVAARIKKHDATQILEYEVSRIASVYFGRIALLLVSVNFMQWHTTKLNKGRHHTKTIIVSDCDVWF